MNPLKLTSFATVLALTGVMFVSCKKETEQTSYTSKSPKLSSSQVVTTGGAVLPPSIGTGTFSATYDKTSKLLTYTVKVDTVTGTPMAVHIHGIADSGFLALPAPLGPYASVSPYAGGVAQTISTSAIAANKKGTITGTLFADGVVIKEEDILGGKFYFDIHTNANPLYTGFGEVRTQIKF